MAARSIGETPMELTSKALSKKIRTQSTELHNLADAIDRFAQLQQTRFIARGRSTLLAIPESSDSAAGPKDDYSDLLPNPPDDPTAWRGAVLLQLRNDTEASKSPFAAFAERQSE